MYNTTNPIKNFKKHHVKEHKEFLARGQKDERSCHESLLQSFQKKGNLQADNLKAKGITKKLLNFIVPNDQPLLVENAGVLGLIEHLWPRYSSPSRRYLLDCTTWTIQLSVNQVSWEVKRSSSHELYYRYLDFRCLPNVILACRKKFISASTIMMIIIIKQTKLWFQNSIGMGRYPKMWTDASLEVERVV